MGAIAPSHLFKPNYNKKRIKMILEVNVLILATLVLTLMIKIKKLEKEIKNLKDK